jgi:hypothetical protein
VTSRPTAYFLLFEDDFVGFWAVSRLIDDDQNRWVQWLHGFINLTGMRTKCSYCGLATLTPRHGSVKN